MNYSSVVITLAGAGMVLGNLFCAKISSSETTGLEADVFERIRRTEGVIDVSLHAHYFEDEATAE